MTTTVVGRVNSAREAEGVVRDLINNCRCDRSDITLVTLPAADTPSRGSVGGGIVLGALKGAVSGAVIGGILGYFANMTALAVPGLESVIAAGPLPSAVVGAGIGALVFGLIGAIVGGFNGGDEDDHHYTEPRRTGTVITVHARDGETTECAVTVLRSHGAREIDKRSSDWMKHDFGSHASIREPVLRPDVEPRAGNPAPARPGNGTPGYNRPMEEAAPVVTRTQPRPADNATPPEGWIRRQYMATYFGPERRKAANQPYSGAERRHST